MEDNQIGKGVEARKNEKLMRKVGKQGRWEFSEAFTVLGFRV